MRRHPAGVLLLVTAQLLAACQGTRSEDPTRASDGGSRTPLRLRFADIINVDVRDVPMMLALDALESQGYTVETLYLASSTLIVDLLARGEAEIGMANNQTMWRAIGQKAPVRTIAQFTTQTYVVAAGPAIRSCRDLDGRTLAVPNTIGIGPILLRDWISRTCPGTKPELVIILESTARRAALLAGTIDAALLTGEELIRMRQQSHGGWHALMTYAEQFPEIQGDGLHVAVRWAERHPEAVRDFIRALLRAHRQVLADPQLLVNESMARLGLDRASAGELAASHVRLRTWDVRGGLTRARIQGTIDFLTARDALPAGLRDGDVADLSYLNAVLAELDAEAAGDPESRP